MTRPLAVFLLLPFCALANDANSEMAAAAKAFLSALTPGQTEKARFDFADKERVDWHFIPRPRKGVSIKEMTQEQRLLAHALLATGLSNRGYSKAVTIMSLESILAILEKDRTGGAVRDPELYFFSIFGEPGTPPWGWRVEGHHLALNFTTAGGASPSMTPSFYGTNPGEVLEGPRKGTRVLEVEEELARELIKALDAEQRKKAVIMEKAPSDILNVPGRNATKAEGIAWNELTPQQREMLMRLIREYVGRHRPDVAEHDIQKLSAAGLDKLHFAWAGGFERGEPHYYRVQGGSFVLEYDNVQNGANHVHSVWRDFDREFGRDLLADHYKDAHSR
jgi:hypothetical protein